MIDPKFFFDSLSDRGVGFYAGVPDSLLADFCACVDDHGRDRHLITANEGNAVALAMGYHMSTGKLGMVYMQNSGLGNAINPLTSLADREVYKVPMILVIGWRGEPGVKDEPQHIKQGKVTLEQLDILEIPYWILDSQSDVDNILDLAFSKIRELSAPVAIVVRKDTFAEYKSHNIGSEISNLGREDALREILKLCTDNDLIVSTTGKTSREIFELRALEGQSQRDFLTVGGMGHTSSIALGVAIGQPNRRVICIDGDGSLLMHMGSMPVIASYNPRKYMHILLNNCSHESVGGQATAVEVVDLSKLAEAVGYSGYAVVSDLEGLKSVWQSFDSSCGPLLLEIRIKKGSRANLGRPTMSAEQNKKSFMEFVGN